MGSASCKPYSQVQQTGHVNSLKQQQQQHSKSGVCLLLGVRCPCSHGYFCLQCWHGLLLLRHGLIFRACSAYRSHTAAAAVVACCCLIHLSESVKPRGVVDLSKVQDVRDGRAATGKANTIQLKTASGGSVCYVCESGVGRASSSGGSSSKRRAVLAELRTPGASSE
jgi:hypothetical protein